MNASTPSQIRLEAEQPQLFNQTSTATVLSPVGFLNVFSSFMTFRMAVVTNLLYSPTYPIVFEYAYLSRREDGTMYAANLSDLGNALLCPYNAPYGLPFDWTGL